MELVYLWVEDYKNIRKQGFNFSPKFHCEYDGETLTIDENDDYIDGFFGENINVTAIVGKNGSGKSNIFEALLCNLMHNELPIDETIGVLSVFYNRDNGQYYYKKLNSGLLRLSVNRINGIKITFDDIISKKYSLKGNLPFTFHYNYSLEWLETNEHNLNLDKLYHKTDDYSTPILLQPNKSNRKIHLSNIDYLATKDILHFTIQNSRSFKNIEKFFIPNKCKLSHLSRNISKDNEFIFKKVEEIKSTAWSIKHFRDYSYFYILRKTIDKYNDSDYDIIKHSRFKSLLEEDDLNKNFDELIKIIKDNDFSDLYYGSYKYSTRKLKEAFNFLNYIKDFKTEDFGWKLLSGEKIIKENKELLSSVPPWVDIEFLDKNNISFYSLSYGQKFIIKFIYSLLNQLENIKEHGYKSVILLLDEVEQGLHPEWQREFLAFLIQVLSLYKEFDFNIICSTHSPLILSDLPQNNIIFLEDGRKVDGLKEKKQTFGANIHTLLSDSFFMEDGLMGEFATKKINDVIKYLNGEKSDIKSDDEAEKLISIIGEPIVKNQLQRMLDSKKLPKVGEIDKIHEEIKELQNRLKDLEVKDDKK